MTTKHIFEAVFLALTAVLVVAKAIDEAEKTLQLSDCLEDSGN